MGKYTKEDILKKVKEDDVEFIRLQFTDIFGDLKNVAITSSQIEKALDNKIMFDGSSIEGFARIEESDMYLYPDYDTYETFPWRPQQGKVARLICDVYKPDGTPFEGDPRYVLKRALAEAKEMGYTMNVGPECEFFLFQTRRQHRDIQTGCKDYCQETWSLRNIHAKAKVWRMRFRYAYEHVAPEGWQEHICR